MRHFILIFTFLALYSCNSNDRKEKDPSSTDQGVSNNSQLDSFYTFQYQIDFTDNNIINKSNRKVDLVFNSIDKYLGGHENSTVRFRTECMSCLSVQEYQGGLLFGKRLFISPDNIKYYKNNIDIPDSIGRVNFNTDAGERTNPKFQFSDGKGSIKYIGISCNDADFNKVRLSYPNGEIVIDSIINASFFEYDLNKDGQNEQYLLGSRNCSQELAILRIRK